MAYEIVPAGATDARSQKIYTCKSPSVVTLAQTGVFVSSVVTSLLKAANVSTEAGRRFSGITARVLHVFGVYVFEVIEKLTVAM